MSSSKELRVHFRFADHTQKDGPDQLLSELDDIGGDELIQEQDGSYTIISRREARAEGVRQFLLFEQRNGRIKLLE